MLHLIKRRLHVSTDQKPITYLCIPHTIAESKTADPMRLLFWEQWVSRGGKVVGSREILTVLTVPSALFYLFTYLLPNSPSSPWYSTDSSLSWALWSPPHSKDLSICCCFCLESSPSSSSCFSATLSARSDSLGSSQIGQVCSFHKTFPS